MSQVAQNMSARELGLEWKVTSLQLEWLPSLESGFPTNRQSLSTGTGSSSQALSAKSVKQLWGREGEWSPMTNDLFSRLFTIRNVVLFEKASFSERLCRPSTLKR